MKSPEYRGGHISGSRLEEFILNAPLLTGFEGSELTTSQTIMIKPKKWLTLWASMPWSLVLVLWSFRMTNGRPNSSNAMTGVPLMVAGGGREDWQLREKLFSWPRAVRGLVVFEGQRSKLLCVCVCVCGTHIWIPFTSHTIVDCFGGRWKTHRLARKVFPLSTWDWTSALNRWV